LLEFLEPDGASCRFSPTRPRPQRLWRSAAGCYYLIAGSGQYLGTYLGDGSSSPPVCWAMVFGALGALLIRKPLASIRRTFSRQVTRREAAEESDPELAIGTAKELFIEIICKAILEAAVPPKLTTCLQR